MRQCQDGAGLSPRRRRLSAREGWTGGNGRSWSKGHGRALLVPQHCPQRPTRKVRGCSREGLRHRRASAAARGPCAGGQVRLCAVRRGPPRGRLCRSGEGHAGVGVRTRAALPAGPVAAQPAEHGSGVGGERVDRRADVRLRRPMGGLRRGRASRPWDSSPSRIPAPIGVRVATAPSASARGVWGDPRSAQSGRRSGKGAHAELTPGSCGEAQRGVWPTAVEGRRGVLAARRGQHDRPTCTGRYVRPQVQTVSPGPRQQGARGGAVGARSQGSAHVVEPRGGRARAGPPRGALLLAQAWAEWSP